jgi:tRNA threonylcarbamoyladenosine biosynthesis protein TsaE
MINLVSNSVEDTLAIGRAIGSVLSGGDVVGLVGPLGAGKTHLVKGLAAGLGVSDARQVNSPTFILVNEYPGRIVVHHVDAYRLRRAEELEAVGFAELCSDDAVVIVEWADRVREAIDRPTLWIELTITGDTQRRLTIQLRDSGVASRLQGAGVDRWDAARDNRA